MSTLLVTAHHLQGTTENTLRVKPPARPLDVDAL
jgi:hypothetical protein